LPAGVGGCSPLNTSTHRRPSCAHAAAVARAAFDCSAPMITIVSALWSRASTARTRACAPCVARQADRADVVALDPDLRADRLAEAGEAMERRGEMGERDAREMVEARPRHQP